MPAASKMGIAVQGFDNLWSLGLLMALHDLCFQAINSSCSLTLKAGSLTPAIQMLAPPTREKWGLNGARSLHKSCQPATKVSLPRAVTGTHALCCLAGSAVARDTRSCWEAARSANKDGPPSGMPLGEQLDLNDESFSVQQLFKILFLLQRQL